MLNRRGFVGFALAGALAQAAPSVAHTPYGQWVVYRQKHLLIGAHRGDARTYELAKTIVAGLARELPEARARVARGPRPQRIASLMSTGQLFVTVLSAEEAALMAQASGPFEGYRPTQIHALADLNDGYLLFATSDFPDDHARLVVQAIDHAGLGSAPAAEYQPIHAAAKRYWDTIEP